MKTLAVYLPKTGIVQKVPVVDGAVPDAGIEDPLKASDVATADVFPMQSYAADLAAQTRTTQDDRQATLALASDVLFATGSAELGPAAQATLAAAAEQIALRKPGTVQIVGHTDSVDTTESNQVLSEQRAAVAAALRPLVSEADYVTQAGIPVHVAATEARIVDGHLIVTLSSTRLDDAVKSVVSPGAMEAGFALPDEFSTVKTTGAWRS